MVLDIIYDDFKCTVAPFSGVFLLQFYAHVSIKQGHRRISQNTGVGQRVR